MKVMDFFDHYMKPYIMKGLRIVHPAPTGVISDRLSCIKEYDAQIWFYRKDGTTIAIDAGHKNYPRIDEKLKTINIAPEQVRAVLLTHADIDHAGGLDKKSRNIFPHASVFLSEAEEQYITNKQWRLKQLGIKINNSVSLQQGYTLLKDEACFYINNIKIEALLTPGHTLGHMCYLVDDEILFCGDCVAVNENGGHCFMRFFNVDTDMNIRSVKKLKQRLEHKKIKAVCTGHSGYYPDVEHLFDNIEIVAHINRRHPFDINAPYDVFRDDE